MDAALPTAIADRALARLEREYQACLNAKPSGTPPEEPDYEFKALGDDSDAEDADNEEFGSFISGDGSASSDQKDFTSTAASEPLHKPMTKEHREKILTIMRDIKVKPPPWAIGMTTDEWMAQLLAARFFLGFGSAQFVSTGAAPQPAQLKQTKKKRQKSQQDAASSEPLLTSSSTAAASSSPSLDWTDLPDAPPKSDDAGTNEPSASDADPFAALQQRQRQTPQAASTAPPSAEPALLPTTPGADSFASQPDGWA